MDQHAAIVRVLNEFAFGVDTRAWDRLPLVLSDPVRIDYSSVAGGAAATVAVADLIESWKSVIGRLTATQHVVTNHLVDVDRDGQGAVCRANLTAAHVLADETSGEGSLWTLGGRYEFELRIEAGRWLISSITLEALWQTGNSNILREAAQRGGL